MDPWYTEAANRRCSILVRSAASEEGPKNPLKGIAVKPLVPAAYAQFGVGAEWKVRLTHLRILGDSQRHGKPDPASVETCFCAGASSLTSVRLRLEPVLR